MCIPIQRYVNAGYLDIVDGRCGFEAFKQTHVTWTQAGRRVMELLDSIEDQRLEAAFNDF